jgi:hypothetical protein
MRVFLFFNAFSTPQGQGYGHVRVTLPEDMKMTHEVILQVERQTKAKEGYLAFTVTSFQELEA